MTKEEFETKYASDAELTVEELHKIGFVAEVCTCKKEDCKGWVYTPTTQEAVNFNLNYENRHINKVFDGRQVYKSFQGSHYHIHGCPLTGSSEYKLFTFSVSNEVLNYQGKTYRPCGCAIESYKRNSCCNKWWAELTEEQKIIVHYTCYYIDKPNRGLSNIPQVIRLHDSLIEGQTNKND